jgi:hypothetical protein
MDLWYFPVADLAVNSLTSGPQLMKLKPSEELQALSYERKDRGGDSYVSSVQIMDISCSGKPAQ